MKGKIFQPGEIDKMLPLLESIVRDIADCYRRIVVALDTENRAKKAQDELALKAAQEESKRVLDEFQSLIREVEDLGGTVKDYEHGYVDFYGELNSQIVYFCWKPGEKKIGYYHELEEGMAKRRGLPVPASP